jgi:hypothetical protein
MAGPAANFASFTLISREMGRKPALIYLSQRLSSVSSKHFPRKINYGFPHKNY